VHNILYREEQAGYLAGYAAVMDGYTKLGFLGGMAVPAVVRYGYGYVQGADAAAQKLGLAPGSVEIKYWYSGVFAPNDDIKTKMSGWYTEGTEVVFACGGGIYLSATAAADAAGGKVIGVDVDQSAESPTIITSAMKDLTEVSQARPGLPLCQQRHMGCRACWQNSCSRCGRKTALACPPQPIAGVLSNSRSMNTTHSLRTCNPAP